MQIAELEREAQISAVLPGLKVQREIPAPNQDPFTENERADTVEGKRGCGMNWEIGIDIYTIPCVKQIASGNLLYSAENSAPCSVVT